MQFSKELLKGTAEVIVLHAVQELGEAYGYQLITEIARSSDNIFEMQEGTLYPLLYRLEEKGLVASKKRLTPNGKERRYYSLTPNGTRALTERKKELGLFLNGLTHALHLAI